MPTVTVQLKGGDQYAKKLESIARRLGNGGALKVGFLGGANYPAKDGKPAIPVAQVAFWNEYGTKRAPARPFMRNTIARDMPKWPKYMVQMAPAANYDGNRLLGWFGGRMVGQIQKTINEFKDPPNAPYTVRMKGYDAPLRHTKQMLRSVAYEVVSGS